MEEGGVKEEEDEFKAPYIISFITEAIGIAIMMFIGCMGCIIDFGVGSMIPAFTFGLAILCSCQAVGHYSPCHINPAVSLGFVILGKMKPIRFLVYVCGQYVGAHLGFILLKLVIPRTNNLCLLHLKQGLSPIQGFFVEYLSTFILIFFVAGALDVRTSYPDSLHLRIGFGVAGIVFGAEPFTGAGLNPARSLPPALILNIWKDHWLYELAPFLGMATAAAFYRFVLDINEKYSLHHYLANRKK